MKNTSFKNNIQWAWDATSIETAMTCPRKYYYVMIEGRRPIKKSVHLYFGGLYAKALEHFYKYRARGASIDAAVCRVVRETLIATWDADMGQPMPFSHAAKTRFSLIRSIVWYLAEFADESKGGLQTYMLKNGKPAVELSFSFEMLEDIVLCGHLDRVATMGDEKYVMDQKTTGATLTSYYFDQFKPHNQFSLYTLAGKIVLDTPIKGVIIDAAQVAVSFTRFERSITYRTEEELNEWWESVLTTIRLTQSYTALDKFPMNLSACGNYGGCPFRHVCAAAPKIREKILAHDFKIKTWDPIKRR